MWNDTWMGVSKIESPSKSERKYGDWITSFMVVNETFHYKHRGYGGSFGLGNLFSFY